MKNQYLGDVSDYRKYALLRALAQGGRVRIGVCWMLTPDDERPGGRKLAYLGQPDRWRAFDPPLFDLLRQVVDAPESRRLALVETGEVIPEASFFDALVPDERGAREAWFADALAALRDADLVFFDPDNGVDVASKPKGRKESSKFAFRDELKATLVAGHSVLVYQHFAREERQGHLRRLGTQLGEMAPDATVWVFETAHVAFLLVVQPQHADRLNVDAVIAQEHRVADMFRAIWRL